MNIAKDFSIQYSQLNVENRVVFNEIFTPRNGYIQLFDQTGFLALIDTRTERVWFNQNRPLRSLNASINQIYATNSFVQEMIKDKKAYDLRTWLWQAVSHSHGLQLPAVNTELFFKLNIWPQLEAGSQRSDYLKIAACFALGAKVKDVEQHLGLSRESIEKFVAMAELIRLGDWIEQSSAKFCTAQQQDSAGQVSALRSFFGKLRKTLGL